MEPVIKIKDYQLKELKRLLAPDEQLLLAVNHGKLRDEPGKALRAEELDYLLLTDKRLIEIKGRFFKDRIGFCPYPRRLVTGAEFRHFLVGCTVTVQFKNERGDDDDISVQFNNIAKPDAEIIVKVLTDQIEMRQCPRCMRRLKDDFTFCPMCGAPLKRICPRCGKSIPQDRKECQACGC